MKKIFPFIFISIFLISCGKKEYKDPETIYEPILMERSELESSIAFLNPKTLKNTGKIFRYGNYIFITENYDGIHVIDNSDPTSPLNKGFIRVPGCVDMAIKNGYLYVDNATDLVTIDLNNPLVPVVVDREKDVFPDLAPPDNRVPPTIYQPNNRPSNTVIVKWK
jgi:hypothetical protein